MSLPLSAATKLDAVNQMLASIGQSPVNSLDVTGIRDVAIASLALDNITLQVLNKGWSFNSDYNYEFVPDVNDEIVVPTTALYVDPVYRSKDYVMRDDTGVMKLYDRVNRTFKIYDNPLLANVTWAFPFESIPSVARTYISTRAARIFQSQVLASDILFKFTQLHEDEAKADLMLLENRQKDHNMLHSNSSSNAIFHRRNNPRRF